MQTFHSPDRYMVHANGTLAQQEQEIREHVDWLMDAGFDFISTENGGWELSS